MLWAYVLRSRKSSAPMASRKGGPPPSGVSPVTCARAPVRLAAAAPSIAPEALFNSDLRLSAPCFSESDFFMDSLPGRGYCAAAACRIQGGHQACNYLLVLLS